ncbi:hypothetical protein Pla110_28060 [Polystyrenella longa]|uniref:Uncharacterized protein n=1 Tax=Polystyrenella longa TaxID=2528007 RepID=A0A518CPC5_9PLAN|nr:hypothetical protein Pla110_28060 [Polystyrenella longa]
MNWCVHDWSLRTKCHHEHPEEDAITTIGHTDQRGLINNSVSSGERLQCHPHAHSELLISLSKVPDRPATKEKLAFVAFRRFPVFSLLYFIRNLRIVFLNGCSVERYIKEEFSGCTLFQFKLAKQNCQSL